MRLKDKVAIVTGAGSGFGAGIARRFAEEGAQVIVNDVAPQGEKVAKDIGGRFVQGDVTKSADWARLVREAGERLDIVVNNAGWTHRNKPYLEVTEAEFAGGTVSEEAKKRFMATIPLGRFSTPLDVANACLYLASDEAAMISGVCIEVDGARCV